MVEGFKNSPGSETAPSPVGRDLTRIFLLSGSNSQATSKRSATAEKPAGRCLSSRSSSRCAGTESQVLKDNSRESPLRAAMVSRREASTEKPSRTISCGENTFCSTKSINRSLTPSTENPVAFMVMISRRESNGDSDRPPPCSSPWVFMRLRTSLYHNAVFFTESDRLI